MTCWRWQCATPPLLLIPPANPSAGLLFTVITHPAQCYTSPHTETPGWLHIHVHTCKPTQTFGYNMNFYPVLNFIWLWLLNVKCINLDYVFLYFVHLMMNFTETPHLLWIILLFHSLIIWHWVHRWCVLYNTETASTCCNQKTRMKSRAGSAYRIKHGVENVTLMTLDTVTKHMGPAHP